MRNQQSLPAHKAPRDLHESITRSVKAQDTWNDLTPLARSEFACWVMSAKKASTRQHRIERTIEELLEGKRRPCCWAGCPHR